MAKEMADVLMFAAMIAVTGIDMVSPTLQFELFRLPNVATTL
jgi:hypothetical protein